MLRLGWSVVSLVLFLTVGCGRPPLSEATLRLSVIREGPTVTNGWFALENEGYPCGKLDATATINGVPVPLQNDGTRDRGWHWFVPLPGCLPPSFELDRTAAAQLAGPFELVIESGDERVVFHSEALLTAGLVGPAEVAPGGTLRVVPNGDFAFFGVFITMDVEHPSLVRSDTDSREVAAQKRAWASWPMSGDAEAVEATVPDNLPEGDYRWRVEHLSLQVPHERCEGVSSCRVTLSLDEKGTVSVRR
jgi:hypothetical protein